MPGRSFSVLNTFEHRWWLLEGMSEAIKATIVHDFKIIMSVSEEAICVHCSDSTRFCVV